MLDIEDLERLKKIRKELGLTQKRLAHEVSTSQSTINKIENGNLNPSLKLAKKILKFLRKTISDRTQIAKDMMETNIVTFRPEQQALEAVKIMTDKAISQVPVMENNRVIGTITEKCLLEKALSLGYERQVLRNIMDDVLPMVPVDTDAVELKMLLKNHPGILVQSKGDLLGIITKTDFLNHLIEKDGDK